MNRTRKPYIRNRRTGVIHKQPTREGCNVDQVPRKFREPLDDWVPSQDGDRLCRYCFPEGWP